MPIIFPPQQPATVDLVDLLPFVLPQLKQCPEETVVFNMLQAIIELCKKSLVWREAQEPITTLANTTNYEYQLSDDRRMHKLLLVTLAGEEVEVIGADAGRLRDARQCYGPYAYGGPSSVELRPAVAADLVLQTFGAVVPSLSATAVPADIGEQYAQEISYGTLFRLFGHTSREYGDAQQALKNKALWEEAIADIRIAAWKAHSRSFPRVTPHWF